AAGGAKGPLGGVGTGGGAPRPRRGQRRGAPTGPPRQQVPAWLAAKMTSGSAIKATRRGRVITAIIPVGVTRGHAAAPASQSQAAAVQPTDDRHHIATSSR